MKIIAVRHGETEDNRRGILRGRPEQGLTDIGQKQVNIVAIELKDEHFDAIYSSDFQRCIESMEIIQAHHASTVTRLESRLRELGEGKSKFPLWLPAFMIEPVLGLILRLNISTPGGESWKDLKIRVRGFLNEIYDHYPDATILLITHGITIRAIKDILVNDNDTSTKNKIVSNGQTVRLAMSRRIAD